MILIHGSGLTALACHRLLTARGITAARTEVTGAGGPPLLIGTETLNLLAEVFDDDTLRDIGHPVPGRIVIRPEATATVEAPARAIWSAALVARLSDKTPPPVAPELPATIRLDATGRQAVLAGQIAGIRPTVFGRRHMVTAQVSGSARNAVLEMLPDGWLFLFPVSGDQVVVQAMLPGPPEDDRAALTGAMAQSRLIRLLTEPGPFSVAAAPAAPQILPVIGSDRWLAVGAAAFAVDPVCGNGTGMALHSAKLAVALASAAQTNGAGARIDHYHKRHQLAFAMHLRETAKIYLPFKKDVGWSTEMRDTEAALTQPSTAALMDGSHLRLRLSCGVLVSRWSHHGP